MKNITIETNWVRVIGNTICPDNEKMNDMIGQELEVKYSNYANNTFTVWNKNKSDYWCFNKKDVRFLTPATFNERHIAIGDEVLVDGEWKKVLGFYVYSSKVFIPTGTPENTFTYSVSDIKDHRTETVSLSGTEVEVIVDGVSYQAVIK